MDPAREGMWDVKKNRCHVCEARALEAQAHADNGGSLEGLYFSVYPADEAEEVP